MTVPIVQAVQIVPVVQEKDLGLEWLEPIGRSDRLNEALERF
jgi:hypothetical protein